MRHYAVVTGVEPLEWRQPLWSPTVLFSALAVPVGIFVLILSPFVLTSNQPSHLSGGITFVVCGFAFLAEGLFFLTSSAGQVRGYSDGRFVFISPRRTLCVSPGDLTSIRCIWIDPQRLTPMRVRSGSGSILVFSGVLRSEELLGALKRANPKPRSPAHSPST
jgi:hypothetical protein